MRAQRRDKNEPSIRARAEALGFLWLENNASTKGRPDACLLRNGHTYWCEVKVPGEPYTKAQREEFPRLVAKGVPVYVLETPDDVVRLQQATLRPWAPSDVAAVVSRGRGSRARTPRAFRPGVDRARFGFAEWCEVEHCVTSRVSGSKRCLKHATPSPVARESLNHSGEAHEADSGAGVEDAAHEPRPHR